MNCSDDLPIVPGPIQRLAPELLGEIFLYCVPSPAQPIAYEVAPLLLLHVSRQWSDVAKGTPRLWQDAHLGLKHKTTWDPCPMLQMWFTYSASLPLSLTFNIHRFRDREQMTKTLDMILDNFHRVSKLVGVLPPWFATYLYDQRDRLPLYAPSLTEMSVGGWDKLPVLEEVESREVALRHLAGCFIVPQLEILKLNGTRHQLSLLNFNPSHLRELHDLYVMEVAVVIPMDILSTFTNLRELSIFLHDIAEPKTCQIPNRIYIPSLRYLAVGSFPGYDPHIFLGALDVPNVEDLKVVSSPPEQVPVEPLLSALTKNKTIPLLNKLTLIGYKITADEYLPWLTKFSKIQTLVIRLCQVDDETIALLTSEPSTPPELWLCPLLSTVIFTRSKIPWAAVIKFVESRSSNRNGVVDEGVLSEVNFDSCENLADEQRSQLLQLRDRSLGLNIIIKDKDPNEKDDRFYRM